MSTMASSSLNPNAPLFIPAAYRQVEDYSPQWWDLVRTNAWFRDHVFRQQPQHQHQHQHQLPEETPQHHDAAALPDDDDLFYAPDHHLFSQYHQEQPLAPWDQQQQMPFNRQADKPAAQQHVGVTADARRFFIHQPR